MDTVLGTKQTVAPKREDPEVVNEDSGRETVDEELSNLTAAATASTEEEDDALSYFQQLAES